MKKNTLINLIFIGIIIISAGLEFFSLKSEKNKFINLDSLSTLQEQRGTLLETLVRKPAVAGQFYPANPQNLKELINKFLKEANPPKTEGEILGLVLPHAGYQFSGLVAAHGFKKLIGENIDTVILIGNSHYERFEGISVFKEGYYETPLGRVKINSSLAQKLIDQNERIFFKRSAHLKEHSLEVELPFLQSVLKNFKIVPILFGNTSKNDYKILAQALLNTIQGENVLLIASSDLSHYPSFKDAREVDRETIKAILTGNVAKLEKTIDNLEHQGIQNVLTLACGEDAIKTLMVVLKELKAKEIKLLRYANSGDLQPENRSRVVGYAAIGFFGERRGNLLNKKEKQKLLEIARSSVETFIEKGKILNFSLKDPALNKKLGAFVTIKKHRQLRGCLGQFSPTTLPLYQVVSQMAIAAATQDKRFPPVQKQELQALTYEISVLSPLRRIKDWHEIELGKHGVVVKKGERSGVFLPQVATDNNWGLEKFMGELCSQKAGLPWDCWKQKDVQLYVFTAQVFEEKETE